MKTSLRLKKDSRHFIYEETFGSVSEFSPTLLVDAGLLEIQPVGDVSCTTYGATNIASAMTGKDYDQIALWADMQKLGKATPYGASPQDAFSTAIASGLRVVSTGEIEKPATAYFQVDEGSQDFFMNVKSAIQSEYNKGFKRPVGCGTKFYAEWLYLPAGSILPVGKTVVSNHEWIVCGWESEKGDMFKVDFWFGRYFYMPRETFNQAMDATYGSVALTFAETEQEVIDYLKSVKTSLLSKAIDLAYNILANLLTKFSTPKVKTPLPQVLPIVSPKVSVAPKYLWDIPENSRHSVRLICDEEGLTVDEKNLICRVVSGESGFNNKAINRNKNGKGVILSTDFGIAQINDAYHIGEGKDFPSVDYVINNPDEMIRYMIRMFRAGHLDWWVAYNNLPK